MYNVNRYSQLVLTILLISIGIGIGALIKTETFNQATLQLFPPLVTLFAAFLGAWYAFKLQNDKLDRDLIDRNVAAGNWAVFGFLQISDRLLTYQKDFIEPYRDDPAAFLQMPPTLPMSRDDIRIDLNSLSFILDFDEPNLLVEISIITSQYLAVIDVINIRSEYHRNVIQPTLEGAGLREGDVKIEDLKKALGERMFKTIQMNTDQVIKFTDATIPHLYSISEKLHEELLKAFPKSRILKFDNNIT